MSGNIWYSWECPVCHAVSKRIVRSRAACRRYGQSHLSNSHGKMNVEILIKEIEVSSRREKSKIGKPSKTDIWVEIFEPFPPGVKHTDLLYIPNHTFIKKSVYKEIMKRVRGEK